MSSLTESPTSSEASADNELRGANGEQTGGVAAPEDPSQLSRSGPDAHQLRYEGPYGRSAGNSGELFLLKMVTAMDEYLRQLRPTQQALVAITEAGCREVLKQRFGRLDLVGSAALRVETPGSDVDVVLLTQPCPSEAAGLPVDVLRKVQWVLKEMVYRLPHLDLLSSELIEDARVPILRVSWGRRDSAVAIDVSVDQMLPRDHVTWFQRAGAAPSPTQPSPASAPLVTLVVRCVKSWMRQRQIPRTKEGALPTIAWLLMAVHVCSLPEHQEQVASQRPMAALLSSLRAFFRYFGSLEKLNGTLLFAADGSSSEFRRNTQPRSANSLWPELAIMDPTRPGTDSNFASRLPAATLLLLAYELQRADLLLQTSTEETGYGESEKHLHDLFLPLEEGINTLPAVVRGTFGALILWDEVVPGSGVQNVQVCLIKCATPRAGWNAPFLLRTDDRSELEVRLLEVDEKSGKCREKPSNPVSLCPCFFICKAELQAIGSRSWRLSNEALNKLLAMRRSVKEIVTPERDQASAPSTVIDGSECSKLSIDCVPSPSRSLCLIEI